MLPIRRVLVTGASGKLGGPLCEALLAEGYHVIGVSRHSPVGVAGVEEVHADVGDSAAMEALVARSDAVIHLATCKEDRDAFIKVSVQGTFNLLEAIALGGVGDRHDRSPSDSSWPAATRSTGSTSTASPCPSAKTCRWPPTRATTRSRKSSRRR